MTVESNPRVALVSSHPGVPVEDLARSLRALACPAAVVQGARDTRWHALMERALRTRGFAGSLTHLPAVTRFLLRGDFEVAHAFSPVDAVASLTWARWSRRPVVFSMAEPPERATLADRRLQLRLLTRALEGSDAIVAADDRMAQAMDRWLVRRPVVAADTEALAALYRSLV